MTKKSEEKYDKILQAAIQVISEKGYENTSISDIVKSAGIAQGTFYLYFPSKSSLIPAIADHLLTITFEKMKLVVSDQDSFWIVLEKVIRTTFETTEDFKDIIILCYSGLAIEHSMEKWEIIYQPFYQWFEEKINLAIKHQEIIDTIDVKLTTKMIINLMENTAERYFIGKEHDALEEEYQKEIYNFIKRSLSAF
ncbi:MULTISPECIES: TetR family transcriptional regulator [Heyndrickxia]|jgi:AcrR family transcriptional regulator|uniref:TetR family transcriptional regulator n=1 Tax=Heyndrickxia oleronia TaxID=38875 RepID=A0A8E2IBL2_9BACI|nr:TetR family transcriptional regulator [Heyndrickxia oleronia]NYV68510.1 TetR family transcriptional regulator [Bacillus sp. Gen3]OJH19951.1 TetR family transcriptional regulator [Bacillus obstructivus]MBU5212411.1 TetR family transcriptional regulator [Heyndrickxia oleronia]MCI1592732.1 TetR family transcriptional regulator [Heyndrickxia oleronia]MCI1615557.1 TetR family transcriptional regulator [Heyndrickxia oleronia]